MHDPQVEAQPSRRRQHVPHPARAHPPGADGDLSGDVVEINGRLDRMDAGRPRPWTRAVLRSLAESPGTRSAELAEQLGIEQARLKPDIRRLKRLGLG